MKARTPVTEMQYMQTDLHVLCKFLQGRRLGYEYKGACSISPQQDTKDQMILIRV